jgi:hypothetical protein
MRLQASGSDRAVINHHKIVQGIVITLGLIFCVLAVPWILESSTGAIGPAILVIGFAGACLALVRPRVGLYIAAFEVIYLDYFKKIAVYYGEVSELTIIQVLVVGMITILCVYLGVLIQFILGRAALRGVDFFLFGGMGVLALAAFAVMYAQSRSVVQAGQMAVNLSIYAGLIVIMPVLLRQERSLEHFLKFVVLCFVPWSIMGLKQYFFGFDPIEWFYAETGLSPVATSQFFVGIQQYGQPRPIGFGSGSVNFGVISLLLPLSTWMLIFNRSQRFLWTICTAFILAAMIVSLQRAAMILPFLGLAFYFFTKTWMRLAIGYTCFSIVIALGIAFSDLILDRLEEVNQAIAAEGRWAGSVLRVGTFADRLRGWERLKEPSTYSLLGAVGTGEMAKTASGSGEYHDVINVILDASGVAGLTLTVLVAIGFAAVVHRIIFSIRDVRNRSLARLLMAAMVPIFVSGMLGGANFHANPFNLVMWMHIGAIYCLLRYDRQRARETPDDPLREPSRAARVPAQRQVALAS